MLETVLITGASGFVGGHLTRLCISRGYEAIAVVRPGRAAVVPAGARAVEVELYDEAVIASTVRAAKPTIIMHLAAYGVAPRDRDPLLMQRVNVDLGAALVRAAAECGAVVVSAGSNSEYAESIDVLHLDEGSSLDTRNLYGSSKAAGGLLALATATALRVPTRHMRVFNIYGPGEAPHRLLPSLIAQRDGSGRIPLSEGRQVRDYLHVEDVAAGLLVTADRLRSGALAGADVLNLCTGVGISIREFVTLAAQSLGIAPERLGFGDLPMRPDEIARLVGNPDRMKFDLGWTPTYVPATGIGAVIGDYAALRREPRARRAGVGQ